MSATVEANGRTYSCPRHPVVVVCYDGCDPSYLADAFVRGIAPALARMVEHGFYTSALSAMPSFTNPNNVSIVCGAPPSVHGISGNYWLDRDTGEEVMMTDARRLRAPTILARLAAAGVKVAAVTAKDKLRRVLAAGLAGPGLAGIAFSAEAANQCTLEEHGIRADDVVPDGRVPDQYSPELSLFVLDQGIKLLERSKADVLYLSLSDFVQHAHAPGAPQADEFIRAVDSRLGRLMELGAVVGFVADHGMTDLSLADGSASIIYLGDLLDARFGARTYKVICPITDPFVRHHGALGGFVRVHQLQGGDLNAVRDYVASIPGIHLALLRDEACRRFDLPYEYEGDIAVIAEKGVALGACRKDHQLNMLAGARLRSHGSLAERPVPFAISMPVRESYRARTRSAPVFNYDIFDFVLNGVEPAA
jgi:phosphonoacetate hydrolase